MFAGTYLIIIFYQTFLDYGKRELVDSKIVRFIIPGAIALGIFFFLVATNYLHFLYHSKYTYLTLCSLFFLLPSTLFLIRFPKFLKKSVGIIGYFFYVTMLFEFTATQLNQWIFTGMYIVKPISLFGLGFVPFEELFFVGIVGPITAIAFYEFFDDDLR